MVSSIYASATTNKKPKYQRGSLVSPNRPPPLVKVSPVKTTMPARVVTITGAEGRLCTKGMRRVRKKCRMSTCVHMDSKNHPVWNRAT